MALMVIWLLLAVYFAQGVPIFDAGQKEGLSLKENLLKRSEVRPGPASTPFKDAPENEYYWEMFKASTQYVFQESGDRIIEYFHLYMDEDGLMPKDDFVHVSNDIFFRFHMKKLHILMLEAVAAKFAKGAGMVDVREFLAALQPAMMRVHAPASVSSPGREYYWEMFKESTQQIFEEHRDRILDYFQPIMDEGGLMHREEFVDICNDIFFHHMKTPFHVHMVEAAAEKFDKGAGMVDVREFLETMRTPGHEYFWEMFKESTQQIFQAHRDRILDYFHPIMDEGGLMYRDAFIDICNEIFFPNTKTPFHVRMLEAAAEMFDKGAGMVDVREFLEIMGVSTYSGWEWKFFKTYFMRNYHRKMFLVTRHFGSIMDNNGFVTKDVFKNGISDLSSHVGFLLPSDVLEAVADKFDHGDGMIEVREFVAALQDGWETVHASNRIRAARWRPIGDALREFVFQTKDIESPDLDLKQPPLFGLKTDRWENVALPTGEESGEAGTLNGWFLEPPSEVTPNGVAVLYLHGVTDTRGEHHRVGLYNLLNRMGYIVLTFDYRGFGDSTGTSLDEDTVVEDALAALKWLEERIKPNTELFVWGHSMGTGIGSSAMAKYFTEKGPEARVKGLVLESPYNSFNDEFKYNLEMFPDTLISWLMRNPPQRPSHILWLTNMRFDSQIHIMDIKCPVMILHAEDDPVIPFRLGEKLYRYAVKKQKKDVEFHPFAAELGLQHSDIYKADNLPGIITSFLV